MKYAKPALTTATATTKQLLENGTTSTTTEGIRRALGISRSPDVSLVDVFVGDATPSPRNLANIGISKGLNKGAQHLREPYLDWYENPLRKMPDTMPDSQFFDSVDNYLGTEQYGKNPNTGGTTPDSIYSWDRRFRQGGETRSFNIDKTTSSESIGTFEWQRNTDRPVQTHDVHYR